MIRLALSALLLWPSTILVTQPPAHLRIENFDANLRVPVVFSPDPDRACREADKRAGAEYSAGSLACTVTTEGTPYIIVPTHACPAHRKALVDHELGHIIGLLLDEDTSAHIGWLPRRVSCADPEPETIP